MMTKENDNVKYFVLDTSVFIHNPRSILSFKGSVVVIPLAVLEELDSLKKSSGEKGRNARESIRFLEKIKGKKALEKGIKIEDDILLKIELTYAQPQDIDISTDKRDNKIILTALKLKKEEKKVFFISKDINARTKAMALGIFAEDYEKEKVDFEELYRGYISKSITVEQRSEIIEKGFLDYEENSLLPNQYVILETKEEKEPLGGRFDSEHSRIILVKEQEKAVWGIKPRNLLQQFAMDMILDDSISLVTMVGIAGTGKTLLALACALKKTIDDHTYKKLLVSRPVIPLGKDIGFLPGSKEQKLSHWMEPIFDNLEQLTGGSENKSYSTPEYLIDSKFIELEAVTYIRGRSLPRQFIIIDEAQNLTPHEVKTIVSRAGEETKVVLTGDPYQIDNPYLDANSNGLSYLVDRFKKEKVHAHITLAKSERSYLAELAAKLL